MGVRHNRCAACPEGSPPGYAVALQRACTGPLLGHKPQPRGLGPQTRRLPDSHFIEVHHLLVAGFSYERNRLQAAPILDFSRGV